MQKNKEQEAQEVQPEEFDLSSINTLDKSNEGIDVDILSPEGEGTGMGLSLCRTLIQKHGGP